LICFARSVPCGRSLNTVAFAGNSFYFDMCSAALHYCTQAVSGTVNCLVCRYLPQKSTVHFVQGALSFETLSGENTTETIYVFSTVTISLVFS